MKRIVLAALLMIIAATFVTGVSEGSAIDYSFDLRSTQEYKNVMAMDDDALVLSKMLLDHAYRERFEGAVISPAISKETEKYTDSQILVYKGIWDLVYLDRYKNTNTQSEPTQSQVTSATEPPAQSSSKRYGAWFDYGLGAYLPNPAKVFGHPVTIASLLTSNEKDYFSTIIREASRNDSELYFAACKEYGFNKNIESPLGGSYRMDNGAGISVEITLIGNEMFITANRD